MNLVYSLFKGLGLILLYPFSVVYGGIMLIRNFLYRITLFKTNATSVFSIGIGNITVGGTGKTPHIEYFIRHFLTQKNIATLSRGYGRKTTGFFAVDAFMGPQLVGDEPWQFFLKFGQKVRVNVGEKRAPAAEKIHELFPEVDLLLMDDVFQHRAVSPDFSILLCDYSRPFFYDYPFPAGRLREFRQGAKRADTIIVSKCPEEISVEERLFFKRKLAHYAPSVPVAFSMFAYGEAIVVGKSSLKPSNWLLVTGIARPEPLIQYLQTKNALLGHLQYADHHEFSEADAMDVVNAYQVLENKDAGVLLTEKDYARLSAAIKALWKELPVFYIPIAVKFIEGEELLLQNIHRAIDRKA